MRYIKRVFLKISGNSHESICTRVSFLVKCQIEASKFIKKETVAPFFIEHLRWLLLKNHSTNILVFMCRKN